VHAISSNNFINKTKMGKMENILKYKTNINCSSCVASVAPLLNKVNDINHWSVDTAHRDKILTVHAEGISEEDIVKVVEKAGFKIKVINQ
jgi:copper chaperone